MSSVNLPLTPSTTTKDLLGSTRKIARDIEGNEVQDKSASTSVGPPPPFILSPSTSFDLGHHGNDHSSLSASPHFSASHPGSFDSSRQGSQSKTKGNEVPNLWTAIDRIREERDRRADTAARSEEQREHDTEAVDTWSPREEVEPTRRDPFAASQPVAAPSTILDLAATQHQQQRNRRYSSRSSRHSSTSDLQALAANFSIQEESETEVLNNDVDFRTTEHGDESIPSTNAQSLATFPPFKIIGPSPLSSTINLPAVVAAAEAARTHAYKQKDEDVMQGSAIAPGGGGVPGPAMGPGEQGSGASLTRSGITGGLQAGRPHHGLNALSPLQSFSPLPGTSPNRSRAHSRNNSGSMSFGQLQPLTITKVPQPRSAGENRSPESPRTAPGLTLGTSPGSGDRAMRPRTSSTGLTRSLSRRESMSASRSMLGLTHDRGQSGGGGSVTGGGGAESPMMYGSMGGTGSGTSTPAIGRATANPGGLISKITLVRAPSVGKKDREEGFQARHRSKSSGSLTPFTTMPSPVIPVSTSSPTDLSRTMSKGNSPQKEGRARGPGSFSLVGGYGPAPTGKVESGFASRSLNQVERSNPLNLHEERKALSPEEIVALAEMIRSPNLAADSDEDGAGPKQSLSRSSSFKRTGSFRKARTGSSASFKGRMEAQAQAEKEKQQLELEPVEYVEMNDDVLLPFVDRPSEVSELIQSAHNVEIFQIIQPMFPTTSQADPADPDSWRSVKPYDWTWDEFQKHLLEQRAIVDDFEWVRRARVAVRKHSEAAWERVGTILGCDGDLLSAGEDYGVFGPGGALGEDYNGEEPEPETPAMYADESYGFLGDSQGRGQVWVEGLEAADDDTFSLDRGIREEDHDEGNVIRDMSPFGSPMDPGDEPDQGISTGRLAGGRVPLKRKSTLTPADVAGEQADSNDPFGHPSPALRDRGYSAGTTNEASAAETGDPTVPRSESSKVRSKSFVGLQISTKPSLPVDPTEFHRPSSSSFLPPSLGHHPHFERGPGSPLFPTSFSRLSLAPTLPNNNPELKMQRMSFNAQLGENAGMPDVPRGSAGRGSGHPGKDWMGLTRRKSGGGWSRVSESALTFESEE